MIHIMDGRSRIASLEEYGATWTGSTSDPVVYNLEDHLGCSSFSLNASGGLMSREEYFPFGETSFGSFSKKRYRFCGKERDEESGLDYYGARYYAAWTCRFFSVDPLAEEYVFYTPYQYAGNKPINYLDLDGLEEGLKEGQVPAGQIPASEQGGVYQIDAHRTKQGKVDYKITNRTPPKLNSLSPTQKTTFFVSMYRSDGTVEYLNREYHGLEGAAKASLDKTWWERDGWFRINGKGQKEPVDVINHHSASQSQSSGGIQKPTTSNTPPNPKVQLPNKPPTLPSDPDPEENNPPTRFRVYFFDAKNSYLDPKATSTRMESLVEKYRDLTQFEVIITGHTDRTVSEEEEMYLSLEEQQRLAEDLQYARANRVKDNLIELGVDPNRIHVQPGDWFLNGGDELESADVEIINTANAQDAAKLSKLRNWKFNRLLWDAK